VKLFNLNETIDVLKHYAPEH